MSLNAYIYALAIAVFALVACKVHAEDIRAPDGRVFVCVQVSKNLTVCTEK